MEEVDGSSNVERPPPKPNPLNDDEIWVNDVIDEIINGNDDKPSPLVATLLSDDYITTQTILQHMNNEIDAPKLQIAAMNQDAVSGNYEHDLSDGSNEMEEAQIHNPFDTDTPVMNAMMNELDNSGWKPTLNTIIEETVFDVSCDDNQPCIKPIIHTNKRDRGRTRRHNQYTNNYYNKINSAISNNGLYRAQVMNAQNDGGANRTVTNNKTLLVHFEAIDPYPINGVSNESPAIYCTGRGYLPWTSKSGETLLVRCLYCAEASGTIISPNDIVAQYQQHYSGWTMTTNFDSKCATLQFISRDGINHVYFDAYGKNNLWYHYLDINSEQTYHTLHNHAKSIIRALSQGASYQLWHHRLGHVSDKVMQQAHLHCKGVPKFRKHHFFQCSTCLASKFKKKHIGPKRVASKPPSSNDTSNMEVGQHLHADFGFVRGSDYSAVDKHGKLITSKDGYRSYCLVIDKKSRYIWVILTQTKELPIKELRDLLKKLQSKVTSAYKTITTDNGKELGASAKFRNMLMEDNIEYTLKTTGAYSSAQNGLAEKPNQDLGRMMRSLLYSAGLGSEYWSYALRHSVYLKNRLPHASLQWVTPYQQLNGTMPDLSNIRCFGSKVHFMHKTRQKKLDRMDRVGTFMTYKGTNKIGYIIDDQTKRERVATHMSFDEAHISIDSAHHPPMATALQQSGYRPEHDDTCDLKFKLLESSAKAPTKATEGAAAFDVYSTKNMAIPPGEQKQSQLVLQWKCHQVFMDSSMCVVVLQ